MMMTFYWQIQQSWLFYMLIYAKKIQLAYSEQLKITTQSKTKPYRTISMCVSMTTSASAMCNNFNYFCNFNIILSLNLSLS